MYASRDAITVLCVDDDEAFLDLEAEMLRQRADDIDVIPVSSPTEALDAIESEDVDCVVSDYDMPDRNGLELLEAVADRDPDLPFILHTGKGSEEIASDAISAGVADYIQKQPGSEQYDLLANRVRNAVQHAREAAQRERTEEWYRQLFEQRIIGVAISQDGEFVQTNQKFADILGYDREEIVGKQATELVAPDDRDRVSRALRKRERGEVDSVHYVVTVERSNGEHVDLEVNGGRVDYGGEPAILGLLLPVDEHARVVRPTVTRTVRENLVEAADALAATDADDEHVAAARSALERTVDVLGVDDAADDSDCSLAAACRTAWSRLEPGEDAALDVETDATLPADEDAVAAFVEDVVEVTLGRWPTDCSVSVAPIEDGFRVEVSSASLSGQAAGDLIGVDRPRPDPVTDVASRHGWDVLITSVDANTVAYTLEFGTDRRR